MNYPQHNHTDFQSVLHQLKEQWLATAKANDSKLNYGLEATHAHNIIVASRYSSAPLMYAEPQSIVDAMMTALHLGLSLDPRKGHATLLGQIMADSGVTLCTLYPGYKGLIAMACRAGYLVGGEADLVFEQDTFRFRSGQPPIHEHDGRPPQTRGPLKCGYVTGYLRDGRTKCVIVPKEVLHEAYQRGSQMNPEAWNGAYMNSMYRKTCWRFALNEWMAEMEESCGIDPAFAKLITLEHDGGATPQGAQS